MRPIDADAIEELLKENEELENSGRVLMAAFARLKEKVPHWISVEERLPEAHENVLCCGAKGGMFIGWVSGAGTIFDKKTTAFVHGGNGRLITHWMPLPKAPKEVE